MDGSDGVGVARPRVPLIKPPHFEAGREGWWAGWLGWLGSRASVLSSFRLRWSFCPPSGVFWGSVDYQIVFWGSVDYQIVQDGSSLS